MKTLLVIMCAAVGLAIATPPALAKGPKANVSSVGKTSSSSIARTNTVRRVTVRVRLPDGRVVTRVVYRT